MNRGKSGGNIKKLILIIIMGLYFNIALFLPYKNYENKDVVLRGYVIEKNINNEYILKVDRFDKYKLVKKFKIKIYTKEYYEVGDLLLVNGRFTEGDVARNYKGFNYKNYLKQNNIMGIININLEDENEDKNYNNFIKKIGKKRNIEVYISFLKEELNDILIYSYGNEYYGFMQSILLGNKTNLDNDIKILFSETFLSHVLAISGMHVGIVLNSVKKTLNKLCDNYKLNVYFQMMFLFFFYVITGMQISCFRTVLFNLFVLVSKLIYEKSNLIKTVFYTYIILIMLNVYNIINIGLYLSFLSSISIILFNRFFDKLIKINRNKKKNRNGNKHISVSNDKIINRASNYILEFIKESIVISISAQILIIPIMIYFFNYFTFKFIITNLFISIFIGVILKVGYIGIIFNLIHMAFLKKIIILEFIIKIFSKFIEYILRFIFIILELLNKITIFDFYIVTPLILFLILYYMMIAIIIYKFNKNPYRNFRKIKNLKNIKIVNYKKDINNFLKSKKILITFLIIIIICNNTISYYKNKRV